MTIPLLIHQNANKFFLEMRCDISHDAV